MTHNCSSRSISLHYSFVDSNIKHFPIRIGDYQNNLAQGTVNSSTLLPINSYHIQTSNGIAIACPVMVLQLLVCSIRLDKQE